MSSPATVADIQTYLTQTPPELSGRFAALLADALSGYDLTQIQRLVTAVDSLTGDYPPLRQWQTYAQALLDLEEKHQPNAAIVRLESLRAQKETLPPQLSVRALNSLGIAYEKNEQWDRAKQCYQECIEQGQTDHDNLVLGKAYANLAIVHYKEQAFEAAAAGAQAAIACLAQNPAARAWQIPLARAWNEIGLAMMQLGQLAEARQAFEQYLAISRHWAYQVGEGIAHTNLAHICYRQGDTKQAKRYYGLARDISLQVGNLFEAAEAAYGLALVQMQAKSLPADIEAGFEQALTLARQANNHEITTHIFLSRADWQDQQGQPALALAENHRAVETVESLRANIALPEARIRLQGSRIEAYETMVARLCRLGTTTGYAEAFQYAEMAKSRALIEMFAGRPVRPPANIPAAWLTQEAELRHSLRHLYEMPHPPQAQIDILEAELEELRQRIRLHNAEFESFQTVAPLPLADIQARLPSDSVLIEYFTTGDDIWAFTVTATTINGTRLPLTLKELGRAFARIDGKLGQLRHLSRGPDSVLHRPWILGKLYQLLVQPLGRPVETAALVCVVPHSLLHYVPFHALYQPGEAGPVYFSKGASPRPVIYAPSATALFGYCQRKTTAAATGCLAIGYNDDALTESLTQAEAEAAAIAHLTAGQSLTGPQATRTAAFFESGRYRYLHFSCHGWFNPTWPTASSLKLADGRLDVTDILHNLRLDAELVSLSACETGRSHILQGDELIGLVRAFLYAGTPSVLVSHWMVDEWATRLLMEQFYRELIKHKSHPEKGRKAQALTQAQQWLRTRTVDGLKDLLIQAGLSEANQKKLLQAWAVSAGYDAADNLPPDTYLLAHPYYWAAFFLVGDQL